MGKQRSYEVTPEPQNNRPEIITSLDGRELSSMPKSARRAAKKAVQAARNKRPWEMITQDPEELKHLARRANSFNNRSNKRRRDDERDDW